MFLQYCSTGNVVNIDIYYLQIYPYAVPMDMQNAEGIFVGKGKLFDKWVYDQNMLSIDSSP